MTRKLPIAAFIVCTIFLSHAAFAQPRRRAIKPQSIKIYFYKDPGEYIDLSPVTRVIRSSAPARTAILALLAGPTEAERKKGFDGLASASEFTIGKLSIKNGTARINFVVSRTWAGFPGDIAPVRFKKAVELALKQFPTVKKVIVSLNGDVNFES